MDYVLSLVTQKTVTSMTKIMNVYLATQPARLVWMPTETLVNLAMETTFSMEEFVNLLAIPIKGTLMMMNGTVFLVMTLAFLVTVWEMITVQNVTMASS